MPKKNTIQAENITNHIVKWLKEYAGTAKVNGFVVGISGGVDSAVTSALCARTGMPVLCVELPIHQSSNQVRRGQEHIGQLKKKYPNVSNAVTDLTSVFETFKKEVPECVDSDKLHLTLANSRARLRMTTLYYYAGIHGLLVVGTGNKVEDFGVGFYTKYGDGGVDLSPIGDLMKSEVFALGAYLEVSDSILKAAPTDGLFGDDRTDEEQLGASYDELEWAMLHEASGKPMNNLTERENTVLGIYQRLNRINQHKMNKTPVCTIPKVFS